MLLFFIEYQDETQDVKESLRQAKSDVEALKAER